MVHAQHGHIGPTGLIAVPIVMVGLSQEAEIVLMERKVIARDQPKMNNNAIDNHVKVPRLFTGKIHMGMLIVIARFYLNIFHPAKPFWTDVLHIVFHLHAALAFWYQQHMAITKTGKNVSSPLALSLHFLYP